MSGQRDERVHDRDGTVDLSEATWRLGLVAAPYELPARFGEFIRDGRVELAAFVRDEPVAELPEVSVVGPRSIPGR